MPADAQLAGGRAGTDCQVLSPVSPITDGTGSALHLPCRPSSFQYMTRLQPGPAVLRTELHKQPHLDSKAEGAVEVPFPLNGNRTFSELRICKALKLTTAGGGTKKSRGEG